MISKHRRLGKKGFIAGSVVDIYVLIAFVIVIILFFIIFKVTGLVNEDRMSGSADIFSGSVYSSAYLKMPVNLYGQDMTMSDLIALADANPDVYEELFEAYSEKFIMHAIDDDICFYLEVKGTTDDFYYDEAESGCYNLLTDIDMWIWVKTSGIPENRFESYIPSLTSNKLIKVTFFFDIESLSNAYSGTVKYPDYADPGPGAIGFDSDGDPIPVPS